jgi:predicted ribosomally synthesized peptide with nif11-like leader
MKEVFIMSMESAKAFVERMKTDEDFRKKVTELKNADERMRYVKKAGFDFTKEDIELARAELSDDEVGGVVGGVNGCNPDWSGACGWMLFDFI